MKRGVIAVTALAVLSLLCVPMALATRDGAPQTKPGHDKKAHVKFQCEATVVSVSDASIEATVTSGTKTIKAYRDKAQTFSVAPDARIVNKTVKPAKDMTLEGIVEGAQVHLVGAIEGKGDFATFTVTTVILQKLPKQE